MRTIVGVLAAAMAIIAINSAAATESFAIGDIAIVMTGWVGCREVADLDRAKDLAAVQHDIEAAARYTASHACRSLDAGYKAVVDDISVWHGSTCLRARGEPDCYWFPTPFIGKVR